MAYPYYEVGSGGCCDDHILSNNVSSGIMAVSTMSGAGSDLAEAEPDFDLKPVSADIAALANDGTVITGSLEHERRAPDTQTDCTAPLPLPGGTQDETEDETGNNTDSDIIVRGETQEISDGQSPNRLIITAGGRLNVTSGGVVTNTSVNENQLAPYPVPDFHTIGLHLSNGAVANDTVVSGLYAFCFVSSGGTANGVIVDCDGCTDVSSGGRINDVTVNRGGWFNVLSGGVASNTVIEADVSGVTISNGGKLTGRITIGNGARVLVEDGTKIDFDISALIPGSDPLVNNLSWISRWVDANYTLTVSDTQPKGIYILAEGTSWFDQTITVQDPLGNLIGTLSVGQTITIGDSVFTLELEDETLSVAGSGEAKEISDGQTSNGLAVLFGDRLDIASGGTANDIRVDFGGRMYVSDGGTASDIVENGGYVEVENGATATFAPNSFADSFLMTSATIHSGTTANNITVNSRGYLHVFDGGTASDIVENGGYVEVENGAEVTFAANSFAGLFLNTSATIHSGTTASDITVSTGGHLHVFDGGTASDIVEDGGFVYIEDGAEATFVPNTFYGLSLENGSATTHSGTTANNTTVTIGGELYVFSGGIADNIDMNGGTLCLSSGGKLTGKVNYSNGTVTAHDGAIIEFDLSRTMPETEALMNDLSAVSGTPVYSINISQSQEKGTYNLAGGFSGSEQTFSLFSSGSQIGFLTLDQTVNIGGDSYTLSLRDDDLVLSIEDNKTVSQYIYLDFDGENNIRYRNSALNLSFTLSVRNSGISEDRRLAILSELSEKYQEDGIVFTLERPTDTAYSTLFFGTTNAFDNYGDYYAVAEKHDWNNQDKGDCAYILLNATYSDGQIASVAAHMLDHILGYSFMAEGNQTLQNYAESKYLLSTEWNQRDPYNKYCPNDPKTKKRCITGCTNTAAAQIINYWIESGLLDFSLTLNDSDAYSKNNITINGSNKPGSGHLSFSETNKLLANYTPGNKDSIAALCFAAGVIQKADYSSDATSTAWSTELFQRAGFDPSAKRRSYYPKEEYWPKKAEGYQDENSRLSDTDIVIQDLLQGRPVGLSLMWDTGSNDGGAHAVVLDGYDSSSNKFHLNYGWGGSNNGWYTIKELNDRGVYQTITGITPDISPNLEVGSISLNEVAVRQNEDISMHFSIFNTGKEKASATTAFIYGGDVFLGALELAFISPGRSRDLDFTFNAALLPAGENTITVKVASQKDNYSDSTGARTVNVYEEEAISSADNTWQLAAAGGSRTQTEAEYDENGHVAETPLAEGEYVGGRDPVDFREIKLEHAGKYTFTLSETSVDLGFSIYLLTAQNNLKLIKSLTILAPQNNGVLSDLMLEKGTYYVSVKAANQEIPGDSGYRLSFFGTGYLKANNKDDWGDRKSAGFNGEIDFCGVISEETGDLVSNDWVGLGDEFDYRSFLIQDPAMLSFTVTASDTVNFSVCELVEKKDKQGRSTYSLNKLQTTKVKAGTTVNTKGLLLPAENGLAQYCFFVQSANAAKGGSADYSVSFNPSGSIFFTEGDDSDDWGDLNKNGPEGLVADAGILDQNSGTVLDGWVGFGDEFDHAKITLQKAARLSFSIDSTDAAKFVISCLVGKTDKKGNVTFSTKSIQSTSLKKDASGIKSKRILVEAGEYFISMQSTNAKKGGSASYKVELNDAGNATYFFSSGDDGANNYLYDKKRKDAWNSAVLDSEAIVLDGNFLEEGKATIRIDTDTETVIEHKDGETTYTNFVGFGDAMDIRKVELKSAAKLSFDITKTTGGAAKLVVYTVNDSGKMVVSSSKLTTTVKAAASSGVLKDQVVLQKGEYYIAVQSTDASKGKEAYYNVSLNANSVFYEDGDSGTNNYNSKTKKVDALVDAISAAGSPVQGQVLQMDGILDGDAEIEYMDAGGNRYTNFVGSGDDSDIVRIQANAGMKLSLTVTATDAVSLVIYGLQNNGTLKALKTVKSKNNSASLVDFELKAKSASGGRFYVGVIAANAKKGSAAYYNVDVVSVSGQNDAPLSAQEAGSLAMPETGLASSSLLGTQDPLSLDRYDADVLADASASSLAELDDLSGRMNLAALA